MYANRQQQYIHTLISVDSALVPDSVPVMSFFADLVSEFKFNPISDPQRFLAGLVVAKPTGRLRWRTNPTTGEKISIPVSDRSKPEKFEDIPALIEGSEHYTVMQSGEWAGKERPLLLLKPNGVLYEENYICTVRCEVRPKAVSTSAGDVEEWSDNRSIPAFGSECDSEIENGIFPNPWTGEVIQVAGAGCARFWIEFEFGKFIYPMVTDHLDSSAPQLFRGPNNASGQSSPKAADFGERSPNRREETSIPSG